MIDHSHHLDDIAAMREPTPPHNGSLRKDISNAIVGLYKEHLGKGPLKCRTYLQPELVVVVLAGGYTSAEQTLFEAGKWYEVRRVRQIWQDAMQVRFIDAIEALSGRKVKAFMSANHQDPDLSVEMFVLEAEESRRR